MAHDPLVSQILKALDEGEHEVTAWEANYLNSVMQQTYPLTPKQRKVLAQMAEKYLNATLAAELIGQKRLL